MKRRTNCSTPPDRICKPNKSNKENLKAIIRAYIKFNKPDADDEYDFFSKLTNFNEALEKAATARTRENKCHPHQRRVGLRKMTSFSNELKQFASELKSAKTFDELFNTIKSVALGVDGIGELAVYDTAHRLGSYLGLLPEKIYLHAGTRKSAQYFGFDGKRKTIKKSELPKEFDVLSPHEIEDCLCIYKDDFRKYAQRE
jgi:hypothetical protein